MTDTGLRIALLSYRGDPHCGGQGVYVRYLSRALIEIGHHVEVFGARPYPALDPRVPFTAVDSLDLYRGDDPFRRPRRAEIRDGIDVLEYAMMCAGRFPEPLTFSLRVARLLLERTRDFDVVHDNQCLGYGLLRIQRSGLPVVATVHHPVSVDRDLEVARAVSRSKRAALRRWYSFTTMQARVARRLAGSITVSESARADLQRHFRVNAATVAVIPNGVDAELFGPLPAEPRVPGRIVTTSSADAALKGLVFLIEAVAKLRTERPVELVVIGKPRERGAVARAIERFALGDVVRFESDVDVLRLVELYAQAEVAVVPSLYEGFSLPAVEAMACAVPVVATTAGALPEVVGTGGEAGMLVPPGDAEALRDALGRMLSDPSRRARMGARGRQRAVEHFGWGRAAEATAAHLRTVARAWGARC
ncbi:MAG: glycosyltransferase family 4 protein [Actinomycetota bacterium]